MFTRNPSNSDGMRGFGTAAMWITTSYPCIADITFSASVVFTNLKLYAPAPPVVSAPSCGAILSTRNTSEPCWTNSSAMALPAYPALPVTRTFIEGDVFRLIYTSRTFTLTASAPVIRSEWPPLTPSLVDRPTTPSYHAFTF